MSTALGIKLGTSWKAYVTEFRFPGTSLYTTSLELEGLERTQELQINARSDFADALRRIQWIEIVKSKKFTDRDPVDYRKNVVRED